MKVKLKELLIPQPKSKVKAGEGLIDGKYKFYTSSPIQSKYLDDAQYRGPALIFGTGGNASVHYCSDMFSTSTDCLVMYGSEELELIYYYLSGNMQILQDGFKGAGLKHISKNYILNIEIDLPCKETQREIVNIMKKIDVLISERKQQKDQMEKLVMSRFVEMFGDPVANPKKWNTLSFKEAGVRLSDGPFGSNLKSEHYTTEGVRVIRLGNIGVGQFVDNDKTYISKQHYEKLRKYICKAGEIVIGTLGEPNLRACLVPQNIEYAINKADCVHYIPNSKILNTNFVCHYINCPETLLLASGMVHGQTRSRISSGQLAEIPIFIPPLDLQNQFAAFVEQTDKSKYLNEKSIDFCRRLEKSIRQEWL